jgi:hypothetical protein
MIHPVRARIAPGLEIWLPRALEFIVRVARSAGNDGITLPVLAERVYSAMEGRGDAAKRQQSLTVRICYLNRRYLRPLGWQVSANNRYNERRAHGGGYRLRRLSSYETRSK